MSSYRIEFEFETNDPPLTMVVDERGYQRLRILEDPTPKKEEFFWNPDDWEPGPFAKKLVNLLNSTP